MTRDITPAGSPASGAVDEAFAEVRASFDRSCLAARIEALGTMMEADDVTAACGPAPRSRCSAADAPLGPDAETDRSIPGDGGNSPAAPQARLRHRDDIEMTLSG
jgi:hypothetical protein